MKKKLLGFFMFIFFIGITNVSALEERVIKITEDREVEFYDVYSELVPANQKTDTEDFFTFTDNGNGTYTLTIKEGAHIAYCEIAGKRGDVLAKDVTVTSNSKQVYVNMLYGVAVNVDNFNSRSYVTSGTVAYDQENDDNNLRLYTHYHFVNAVINNSNIVLDYEDVHGDGEQNVIHTFFDSGEVGILEINNSTIKTDSVIYTEGGDVKIDNSNVSAFVIGVEKFNTTGTELEYEGTLNINDSTVNLLSNDFKEFILTFYITPKISMFSNANIKNSNINTNGDFDIENTLNIENSTIKSSSGYNNDYLMSRAKNIKATNSNIYLTSALVVEESINLTNSYLEVISGFNEEYANTNARTPLGPVDYSTLSALTVLGDLKLNNSNFKAVSSDSSVVPALAVYGNLTSDKANFVLIDDDLNILELKEVNRENYGFLTEKNGLNFNFIYSTSDTTKTGLLNNKASKVVKSSEYIKYTFKIKNGKWEDGTNEDKELMLLKEIVPDKDTIKSSADKSGYYLEITKTGVNEYTYEYKPIVNPKTGIYSISLLVIVAIGGIIFLNKYKNKFDLFKEL